MTSQTQDDLALNYTYLAGRSTTQTAIPVDPVAFPGDPLDLTSSLALGGQQTASERQLDGSASQGTRWTYDDAGRDGDLHRPERSHHELHVLRRWTGRARERARPARW